MKKFTAMVQIGCAVLLYLLSAVTFIDYMYSLTIRDTVTAIENAFGTLVILVAMLVLAKFTLASGRKKLKELQEPAQAGGKAGQASTGGDEASGSEQRAELDTGQDGEKKEAEN